MVDTSILGTTDASCWAREFCKKFPDIDEGDALCWFANAIETAKTITINKLKKDNVSI